MTLVAYLPATNCRYIWDDDSYLLNNSTLRSSGGLQRIWFELRATPQYYPMVFTSFWGEYHIWGLNAVGYHIVNILLHAAGSILLWRVLVLLEVRGAWAAAALFALHPANVESVAWITERKNVLSGVFYFGTALVYLRCALRSGSSKWGWRYAAVLVLFFCALMSKTVTCTLPAALLLVLWWKRERLGWRDILPLVPLFALGIASGLLTAWMEKGHVGAVGEDWNLSFLDRCLIAGRVISFYAVKLVWPHPLIFIYPRWQIDAGQWWQYLYPLAVLAVIAGLWFGRRRLGRAPLVSILFFAGTLFPALGFFNVYPMRFSFVADHFQYLASAGLIALIVATVCRLADLRSAGGKAIAAVLMVLVLAIFAVMIYRQAPVYKDEESLWRDTIAQNPNAWLGHSNLGHILMSRGEYDAADRSFKEALRLRPDCPEVYFNLGGLRVSQGRLDEALEHYRKALAAAPNQWMMHLGVGLALHAKGRLDEAIAEYREALRLSPDNVKTHRQIGAALQSKEQYDEAISHYRRVLEVNPLDTEMECNLCIALMSQGKTDEAITHCRKALEIEPQSANAHFALGSALQLQGKLDEAVSSYEKALQIKPDFAQVHYTLATVLQEQGKSEAAIQHYRQALKGEPDWPDALIRMAWILATHPDGAIRRPDEAVRLAERAAEITRRQNAQVQDGLAAAYAAMGQFDRAVAAAQESVRLAAAQAPPMVDQISQRLELYKRGLPYLEQPGAPPPQNP
jgi:tetratricopeptide (TPR) repeat protein